jgi:hypothetical protein
MRRCHIYGWSVGSSASLVSCPAELKASKKVVHLLATTTLELSRLETMVNNFPWDFSNPVTLH